MVQPTMEISLEVPRKFEGVLLKDPAIPLLGIYPKDAPTYNKDTCSTIVTTALFIIARSCKEHRCPSTEEWIQKLWYIYSMEYYSAINNNEFMKFLGKWMELESVLLSKVTQSQKNTLTNKQILAQKLKIHKLQFTQHRKLKKEGLSEGALVPLIKGTKYSQEQ